MITQTQTRSIDSIQCAPQKTVRNKPAKKKISKAFLITSTILLTEELGDLLENRIFAPLEWEYYNYLEQNGYCTPEQVDDHLYEDEYFKEWMQQCRWFISAIFHHSIIGKNRITSKDRSSIPIPLSNKKFQEKYSQVFGWSKKRQYGRIPRGIDLLTEMGVLDRIGHRMGVHCTFFSFSKNIQKEIINVSCLSFGNSAEPFYKKERCYDINKGFVDHSIRKAMMEICQSSLKTRARVNGVQRNDLSNFDRRAGTKHCCEQDKVVKDKYRKVYELIQPTELNIDRLLREVIKYARKDDLGKAANLLGAIKSICTDGQYVGNRPFRVLYKPTFRPVVTGGRSFERGQGLQTLPAHLKGAVLEKYNPYNVDIKSSQLNCLRIAMERFGIKCKFLKRYKDIDSLCDALELNRKYRDSVKTLLYGTIFSAGDIKYFTYKKDAIAKGGLPELDEIYIPKKKSVSQKLRIELGTKRAKEAAINWTFVAKDLEVSLKQLATELAKTGRRFKDTQTFKNDVGIKLKMEDSKTYTQKGEVSKYASKTLLAHYVQGIETNFMMDTLLEKGVGILSLEHDGAILAESIDSVTKGILHLEYKELK